MDNLLNEFLSVIEKGVLREVERLMTSHDVTNLHDQDIVIHAVQNKQEDIAVYLIESGFSYTKYYQYPNQFCDQWCYFEHQDEPCPCQYDVLALAREYKMNKLVSLIREIQQGFRKPGDGLGQKPVGLRQIDNTLTVNNSDQRHKTSAKRSCNSSRTSNVRKGRTNSAYTASIHSKTSLSGRNQNGDTELHQMARQTALHVHHCVSDGVNVNTQNFDGDTALHVAVRHCNLDTARALCSNGADLTLRNKLSHTAVSLSEGEMKTMLESYKRGVVCAIKRGEQASMQRIRLLWPNPDAVVAEGRTMLQLAADYADHGPGHQACYNLLKDIKQSMRLVHAVLSADVARLKNVLQEHDWNINVRYKDKYGASVLSCAMDQNNVELVQTLLDTEKCVVDTRIRERHDSEVTMPLKFLCLRKDCPLVIWRAVSQRSSPLHLTDRDGAGNTEILRAISNGLSAEFIQHIITASSGSCLTHRNTEGLHCRELATKLGRSDIVRTIDQYICDNPSYTVINLALGFYGKHHLNVTNQDGEMLVDIVKRLGTEADVQAATQYDKVESNGVRLFIASCNGELASAVKYNTANYQDKNGFTAMTRAVVYNQVKVVEALLTSRPVLLSIPDNNGRYPLHYAYALPEHQSATMVKLLTEKFGEDREHSTDKNGRVPADYQSLRANEDIQSVLTDARVLDSYGKKGEPMAPLPPDILTNL